MTELLLFDVHIIFSWDEWPTLYLLYLWLGNQPAWLKEEELWHSGQLRAVEVVEVLQEPLNLEAFPLPGVEYSLISMAEHRGDKHLAVLQDKVESKNYLIHLFEQQVLVNSDLWE